MLTFAYPILLMSLIAVPLVWLLYWSARRSRKARLRKFGRPEVLAPLMPDVSRYKPGIRIGLRLFALGMLLIAFARPWGGLVQQSANREGIEVMAVVDVSNSMLASASDNPDGSSRIDAAKLMLERMVETMGNDRVGLVVFAQDAYQLIPVSSDYASVRSFLGMIDPNQVTAQGTNIADAIDTALGSFTPDKNVGKAMVILTDVEDLDDEDAVMAAVKRAREKNVQIDVVGVGSPKGAVINTPQGVFTDDNGEVVHTKLNEDLGKQIAKAGGGVYVNASSGNALPTVQKQLKEVKRPASQGYILQEGGKEMRRFITIILCLFAITSIHALDMNARQERKSIVRGNEAYRAKDYQKALTYYNEALKINPSNLTALFNKALATTQIANGLPADKAQDKARMLEQASKDFESVAKHTSDNPSLAARANYNRGNLSFSDKKYEDAIQYYKNALRLNPKDDKARRNLRIAQQNLPKQQQNQNKDKNKDKNKDQDKDKNKDKDRNQDMNNQAADRILKRSTDKENQTRKNFTIGNPNRHSRGW